jgi:Fe-S cluster assembly iron-binding protein IscA
MFEVTELATQNLKSYMDQNKIDSALRVNLLDTCGAIKIDFIDSGMRSGFSISSEKPISGGGCSSSASCGSGCG